MFHYPCFKKAQYFIGNIWAARFKLGVELK
jgi:hypothetical protein